MSAVRADARRTALPAPATARTVAVIRAALYVAVAAAALIDDRPGQFSTTFVVALAIGGVHSAVGLALPTRRGRWLYASAALDLILLVTLAHASGGATSEVRFAFFAIPVLAAMLFPPATTAIVSAVVACSYLTLALNAGTEAELDRQLVYAELVYLVWTALAAILLSRVLSRHALLIGDLARARGQLMVDVLEAEDRERRRLADWLHDGAVQNLLVVRQDLAEAERGDAGALERAQAVVRETIPQLRNVLVDLHPSLLTGAGLEPAIRALADAQARQGAFEVDVVVDPSAEGAHDALLLALTREWLINVVKHARARHVRIAVERRGDGVLLEVRDDGRGFEAADRAAALAGGHIGLASSSERVESFGGRLEVESARGQGTVVRAILPDERT